MLLFNEQLNLILSLIRHFFCELDLDCLINKLSFKKNMRRVLIGSFFSILMVLLSFHYYQYRWRHLWIFENERKTYPIIYHADDTLRIAMIGDSWAGIHSDCIMDSFLQVKLNNLTGLPVKMTSKGKGGEKSRGIYQLLFEENDENGTRAIITSGINYCIVSAGINDAAANLGPRLYCYHMRLILNFLLSNNIRPILIEIPDVNIWKVYGGKPLKDLASDYIRSLMSHCKMYQIKEYRDSLYTMLINENYMDSVIYIQLNEWNGNGTNINKKLFLNDQVHLNNKGYKLLDSCIAVAIAADLSSK